MADKVKLPVEYSLEDLMGDAPEVVVQVGKKQKTFWIKSPTDPEKSMAQNAARQKSRQLRAALEDPETEEHQLLVKAELENMTLDELRLVWLTSNLFQKTFELNRRSMDDRDEYFVPAPEGKEGGIIPPTNEDMDRYEEAKRAQERQRLADVSEQQKVLYAELKTKSETYKLEDMLAIIQPLIIDQQTSREWNNQYGMQVLIRCTYLDNDLTQRAFKTIGDAMRLMNTQSGQKVLDALLNAHSGLLLDPDRLKN